MVDTSAEARDFMRRKMQGKLVRRSSPQRDAQRDPVMKLIFSKPGFASVIARHLNVTHQNVAAWNRVPPHHVLAVAPLVKMTPEQIRPDIFGGGRRKKRS